MEYQIEMLQTTFERDPAMVARRVAGEIVLVPIKPKISGDPSLYTLDEAAAFLWEKIEQGVTGQDLIEELLSRYEASQEQANQDVRNLVEELLSIEAIRVKI